MYSRGCCVLIVWIVELEREKRMLHLRIITPPDLTATVLQELADDPGVTHVAADRGAATEPPGDLVSCDVVRASVNPLIRRLRSAGVTERGGITLTEPEAVISAAADRAQAEILAPEIDTIVWEEVAARTSDDSSFSVSFAVLMVLAGIIAAIAIVTNNPVLVVGAMIVSPDYGPMAALSVALMNRTWGPAWQSFRALTLGFPLAALAALLYTLAARGLGRIPAAYLAGQRPLTGLLIGANLGAFVVAFVAGAAGIIALGRAKSGAVVGVLVSITTIPSASNVGVALAMGDPSEAGRSLSILLVNLAGLLTGGVLTLLAARVWARRIEAGRALFQPKRGL
jgi:uncharacterized hydrophobic protein (TIGR00271 family)